jgi:hypothetical protein
MKIGTHANTRHYTLGTTLPLRCGSRSLTLEHRHLLCRSITDFTFSRSYLLSRLCIRGSLYVSALLTYKACPPVCEYLEVLLAGRTTKGIRRCSLLNIRLSAFICRIKCLKACQFRCIFFCRGFTKRTTI